MKQLSSDNIFITGINEEQNFYQIDKIKAHVDGVLHLAISIFLINEKRELLLQKRAANKYHSAGLWANSCCSHPLFGESEEACAHRRLQEELAVVTEVNVINKIDYKCSVGDLIEQERVTWFRGFLDSKEEINFNREEVAEVHWISIKDLEIEAKKKPEKFANWLHEYLSIGLVGTLLN
jgi:isopentenyl-diphosphate Delta-isomerase